MAPSVLPEVGVEAGMVLRLGVGEGKVCSPAAASHPAATIVLKMNCTARVGAHNFKGV